MREPTSKNVTITQVALKAGVDRSTVSRALDPKKRALISDAVVKRVEATAQALGYRPNQLAAALRTRRSGAVGVLLPDITNPVFPPIVKGIEETLRAAGCVALVANADGDAASQAEVFEQMLARRVDGLIIATAARDDLLVARCIAQHVPFVLVNRGADGAELSMVVNDDRLGTRMAVQHLAALGHTHIAHLAGPQNLSTGFVRRAGFVAAMREAGLPAGSIVNCTGYSREAGKAGCEKLFAKSPDITAIVAANDLLALGCYDALQAMKLTCPADVSVIGHNDMPLMDMVSPAMTTVRIQHREMGAQAARLLLAQIATPERQPECVVLQPAMILRGSTSAARPVEKRGK
ncbi:MAG: LacI family DNA-binding transcriptional regulator [Pseudomonadota bacterium]